MNHFCWGRACAYIVSLCVLLLQNQMCLSSLYAHKWCSCLFITPLLISAGGWLDLPDRSLSSLYSLSIAEAQFHIVQLFSLSIRWINSLSITEICLGSRRCAKTLVYLKAEKILWYCRDPWLQLLLKQDQSKNQSSTPFPCSFSAFLILFFFFCGTSLPLKKPLFWCIGAFQMNTAALSGNCPVWFKLPSPFLKPWTVLSSWTMSLRPSLALYWLLVTSEELNPLCEPPLL